jgi:hypothetical protein
MQGYFTKGELSEMSDKEKQAFSASIATAGEQKLKDFYTHPLNKVSANQPETTWRDLVGSRQDIKNKELLYASLMDEGADQFTTAKGSTKGLYQGMTDFGLDTAGDRLEEFINKGYLDKGIKDRVVKRAVVNESGNSFNSIDFTNLNDVVSVKNAYINNGRDLISKHAAKYNLKLSAKALDYFTVATYNRGEEGAIEILNDYKKNNLLEGDKFLKDSTFQSTRKYKQADLNIRRRLAAADMLKGEGVINPVEQPPTDASGRPLIVYK